MIYRVFSSLFEKNVWAGQTIEKEEEIGWIEVSEAASNFPNHPGI